MKGIFTAFALVCGLLVNAQQWYASYAHHGRDVKASYILNPNTIIVGAGFEVADEFEDILVSSDFGLVWNVYFTGNPTSMVMSYDFKDAQNGYGVCYLGKFFKTTDGGNSWDQVDTMANKIFFEVIYNGPQTLFVTGGSRQNDTATILKSTDGGDTWSTVYNQPGHWLRTITFIDAQNGFAVGDSSAILKTTNGGDTWLPVTAPVNNRTFSGVVFLNATTGYITGGIRDSLRTMLKTIDGGQNWSVIQDEDGGAYNDITFINASLGYLAGDSATVLKTTDGGQTWLPETLPNITADQRINTVYFYNQDFGVIGGNGGFVQLFANTAPPQAVTLPASPVDTTNTVLTGKVNTHGIPATATFYYSTDSTFPFPITNNYSQAFISDSLAYFSAQINQLQPRTTYYYFLRTYSLAGEMNGDTLTFYTDFPAYTLFAGQPANITTVSATITGAVEDIPYPATLTFEYGTNGNLTYQVAATPNVVSDTNYHAISANLTQLLPGTGYSYRLKVETANGVLYSNQNYLNTVNTPSNFVTLPATGVTSSSATLNATVFQLGFPTALSFDYGTTPALGNNIVASPDTVYNSAQYFPTASLSGLQNNTLYYFCFKGKSSNGGTFYGDTIVFYTGSSQVPNFSFEYWTHKAEAYPRGWYYYGNIASTASYNGTRALHLYAGPDSVGSIAFSGIPFQGMDPLMGSPFTARPDSLIFFANYNIAPNDSGFVVMLLKKNFAGIGLTQFPLTGNTGGSYIRHAVPVTYDSGVNPDSVIIAIATTVHLFDVPVPNQNWIKIDNFSFTGTSQNVINANFEDFDTLSYDLPDSWIVSGDAPPNLSTAFPVTKTTDAHQGQYALRMATEDAPAAGMLVSTYLATERQNGPGHHPGFAVNYKCQSLNGYFKYFPANADTMSIAVQMYKNGNEIGNAWLYVDSTTSTYTPFSLFINYYVQGVTPDSASISIRNSVNTPHGSSVLYLDELSFDNFTGVDEVTFAPAEFGSALKVYPNPSQSTVFIQAPGFVTNATLGIYDLTGALVYQQQLNGEKVELDVSGLPAGIFMVKLSAAQKTIQGKMIIVK